MPLKDLAARREYRRGSVQRVRMMALVAYGGDHPVCACCGEWRVEFLVLDHINGDGAEERRRYSTKRSGMHWYALLRRLGYPPGLRVLCANCNGSLGLRGYCPHDQEKEQTA